VLERESNVLFQREMGTTIRSKRLHRMYEADPDLCRNTMKYRNTHKRRDAAEIRLHFINNK
jgi:hypothetical protein